MVFVTVAKSKACKSFFVYDSISMSIHCAWHCGHPLELQAPHCPLARTSPRFGCDALHVLPASIVLSLFGLLLSVVAWVMIRHIQDAPPAALAFCHNRFVLGLMGLAGLGFGVALPAWIISRFDSTSELLAVGAPALFALPILLTLLTPLGLASRALVASRRRARDTQPPSDTYSVRNLL